jgi:hypothetical protein
MIHKCGVKSLRVCFPAARGVDFVDAPFWDIPLLAAGLFLSVDLSFMWV